MLRRGWPSLDNCHRTDDEHLAHGAAPPPSEGRRDQAGTETAFPFRRFKLVLSVSCGLS